MLRSLYVCNCGATVIYNVLRDWSNCHPMRCSKCQEVVRIVTDDVDPCPTCELRIDCLLKRVVYPWGRNSNGAST